MVDGVWLAKLIPTALGLLWNLVATAVADNLVEFLLLRVDDLVFETHQFFHFAATCTDCSKIYGTRSSGSRPKGCLLNPKRILEIQPLIAVVVAVEGDLSEKDDCARVHYDVANALAQFIAVAGKHVKGVCVGMSTPVTR